MFIFGVLAFGCSYKARVVAPSLSPFLQHLGVACPQRPRVYFSRPRWVALAWHRVSATLANP